MASRKSQVLVSAILIIALAGAAGYVYVTHGGMIARQKPGVIETSVATWLVSLSIPASAKEARNPVAVTDASLAAGLAIYQKKCDSCHGYDGTGRTDAGSGVYPAPIELSGMAVKKRTDGELFYFIRNGIRNTAMPGWQMPDESIWQVVDYIRNLPKVAPAAGEETGVRQAASTASAQFVGSAACKSCHSAVYERWSRTRMANVIRDPREHPGAIIPDLSKPDPLVTFSKDDIAFVYGTKWKQRYFKKVGEDYFPLPAQWDIKNKVWRPYHVANTGADWWAEFYPEDNSQRPTGPLCDGCHSVNYSIAAKTVTEWNVGCEKCHGPGGVHIQNAVASNIVNPARLDYVRANDTCTQCHSQGQPLQKPLQGKYYDWPVGFQMGGKLSDYWKLEEPKLGQITFTHFPDGTAHKNRMQGNDFITSVMYTRGVTCFTCHDVHGTDNDALLRKPASAVCLDCHGPGSANGPHAPSIEAHTHHKTGSRGSDCVECHMPSIEQTIANVNVRSHTFKFIPPSETDSLKIPNPCTACHTDKTTKWATDALKTWEGMSSWRVAN